MSEPTYPVTCPTCHKVKEEGERCACENVAWQNIVYPPEGGILSYLEGYKYPYPGLPDERFVNHGAMMKRMLIETTKRLSRSPWRYFMPLLVFVPRKLLTRSLVGWVASISRAGLFFQNSQPIQPQQFCRSGRELLRTLSECLRGLEGQWEEDVKQLIITIVRIWEYDNAYRFRGQDILSCLNKTNLAENPGKEFARLLEILISRERAVYNSEQRRVEASKGLDVFDLGDKWRLFRYVLWALRIFWPGAIHYAATILMDLNLEEIKLDAGDWYFVSERFDYDFGGVSYKDRLRAKVLEDREWRKQNPQRQIDQNRTSGANVGLIPNQQFFHLSEEKARETLDNLVKNFMKEFKRKKYEIAGS